MTRKLMLAAQVCAFIGCCLITTTAYTQIRLPALVRDSMVLQRDTKINIWGWAGKGEKIIVAFNGKKSTAIAGTDGKWSLSLPAMKAGGPYNMEIRGNNKIVLNNVLIGDVWLCSGQSNMVHQMELHNITYAEEIASAHYPEIRHFYIPTLTDLRGPKDTLPDGYWKSANPVDINRFSAVAYFFAKTMYEKYHIPIGLINASVGGTPVEAWTSEEGLKAFPDITSVIEKNKDTGYVNGLNRVAAAAMANKPKVIDDGLAATLPWFDTAFIPKNWRVINIPGYWEDQGIKDLDGVLWYRREINIPASMTGMPAKVFLGRIVDADFLYVNGKLVGSTGYQYPQRRYLLPAGVLKPGKNLFVIRVINNAGKGGFVPGKPYSIVADGQTLDLKGYWQYKVGSVFVPETNHASGIAAQNQPAALFNAMISPIINYTLKGILWYQGEANTNQPAAYAKLLPALIADWRHQWKHDSIPFLYVQLPNFMEANYLPSKSQWAMTREAQLQTLSVPNTAMAVAIDLGEWNDIHPDNKKDVGLRLALAAERLVYKDTAIIGYSPFYQKSVIDKNKIKIYFRNMGSGLVAPDAIPLQQFAIAGADKKFIWAKAIIEGDHVVVWNDEIANPVYVRYAWADNPEGANLYNKEGLPASPFRTDSGEQ